MREYVVCQGTWELTDPMPKMLAEQELQMMSKWFTNLSLKQVKRGVA